MSKSRFRESSFSRSVAQGDGLAAIVLRDCMRIVEIWAERQRQRRALAALEDYRLTDLGLSREQVRREIGKPFWTR